MSVEEQLRGWLKFVHSGTNAAKQVFPYDRLARLIETLAQWELARFGEPAAAEFVSLRKQRIRIGTQDLKIAAIAKVNDALLLSADSVQARSASEGQPVLAMDAVSLCFCVGLVFGDRE